jgi:DNA-binding NarL/FixJ family response regulator
MIKQDVKNFIKQARKNSINDTEFTKILVEKSKKLTEKVKLLNAMIRELNASIPTWSPKRLRDGHLGNCDHGGAVRSLMEVKYFKETFSVRELEVIIFLMRGMSNREISESLFVGEKAIKYHMTNILMKLRCKSRVEAIFKIAKLLDEDERNGDARE